MQIRPLELGAFLTQARAPTKTFDALITGIPGDVSLAFLSAMFESKQSGGALDYSAFHTRQARLALCGDAECGAGNGATRRVVRRPKRAWRAIYR